MQAYAAKLIDLIDSKAEKIAEQWAADVIKNKRTPSFHSMEKNMVIVQGIDFYKLFRRMSLAGNPYEEAKTFSWKYAEDFYRKRIPLREAIYALMLLRRNLWLYAEFQGAFITVLEKTQAVESLNRTILLFDYVSYQVTEKYEELIHRDVNRRLSVVQTLVKKSCLGGEKNIYKYWIMAAFLLAGFILTFYCHSVLHTGIVFTHLFYIPIVFASICWGKKGIWVAVILGLMLMVSHLIFLRGAPFLEDVVRAGMFIVVGGIVGWLMEDVKKVRELFLKFK